MTLDVSEPAARLRTITTRFLARFGFKDDSFLVILAVFIGAVTAAASVGFHDLILLVRDNLYYRTGEEYLYHGWGMSLLILFPAAGGLMVAVISRWVFRV